MDKSALSAIIVLLVLISVPIYLIWPFELDIAVVTSADRPLVANITIHHSIGPLAESIKTSRDKVSLWKGEYVLKAESPGFEQAIFEISNPIALQPNRDMNLTIRMKPINVSLARFDFRDPTGTIKILPWLEINGTSASGKYIILNVTQNTIIESGWYTIRAVDSHFNATFRFEADKFKDQSLTLYPNDLFEKLDPTEAKYAINFLEDYVTLTRSLPLHFYSHSKSRHLTLGDMITLFCEKSAAEIGHKALDQFYLRTENVYHAGAGRDCYTSSLDGSIPTRVIDELGAPTPKFLAQLLNQGKSRNALAITFEIESGLYRNKKSPRALSPCSNQTTKLGVAAEDLVCNNPPIIPWFSPLEGPHVGGTPYPWATGKEGLEDILSIPERYGLPVSLYITPRDIIVFETIDPTLRLRIRELVKSGLVEIGAQNWYHSQAGARKIGDEQDDLRKTKSFLETEFETNVTGLRMPYFSLLRGNPRTHDDIIRNLGFQYYSGLANQASPHNIPYTHKLSTPFQTINSSIKAVTVIDGKPWDFTHKIVQFGGEESLQRDPDLRQATMAKLLRLVSEGSTLKRMDELSAEFGSKQ